MSAMSLLIQMSHSLPSLGNSASVDGDIIASQQPPQPGKSTAVLLCDQCSYSTRIKHLLHRHVAKHSLDRPFQCPDCGYSDYGHSSFVDHMMDHQQTRILSCCFCKYRTNIFGMRLHIAKHRAVEPYDCSLCEFSSNHPGSLRSHVFQLHTKKFSCNYCKNIMSKYALMKHTKKVHGVSLDNSQVKPFVAVETARGKIENPAMLTDSNCSSETVECGKNISTDNIFPFKLPIPKIVLKRITVDEVSYGIQIPQPLLTNPEFTLPQQSAEPKVPELTIRIPQPEPVVPNDTIRGPESGPITQNTDDAEMLHPDYFTSSDNVLVNIKQEALSDSEEEIDVKPDLETLMKFPSRPKRPKMVFCCNNCNFATRKKSLLRRHAPKHLLDPNLVCTECDFKEPSTYIFAKHLASRRTLQGKVIHCCFCEYSTKSVSNMCAHLDKHKPVSLNDCPKCGLSYSSKSSLNDHYRKMHLQKTECPDCGKRMTKHSIKKHKKTHVIEKTMKPSVEVEDLLQRQEHSVPSKPYFKCSSCSFRTRMKSLLRRHVSKHLLPEAYWSCSLCNYTNSSPYCFAFHLKCHSEGDAYDCCFCDYSTMVIYNLARHLEVHRLVHFFDCSKCGKSFAQYPGLRKHYVKKHVEKHQCMDCAEIMSLYKLQQHRKVHGICENPSGDVLNFAPRKYTYSNGLEEVPVRLYKCNFCNYSTDIEFLASRHVAKHAMNEAYFVCTICQYKDTHNLTFAKHLSFCCFKSPSCCFCEYSSNNYHNLSQHLEIHRSIHFHDCSMCEKSYSSNHSLCKHFKAYHADEHTCQDCGEIVTYYELLQHKKDHGTTMNSHMDWPPQLALEQETSDPSMLHCYHCTYSTRKKSLLRRHAAKHLMDTHFVCPDCDFKENHAREFAKHLVSCQGGFNCSFCPATSYDLSHIASHLEVHRPVLLYDCTECKHSSYSRTNIRHHYQKMHVAEYKCTQCDEVMSRYKLRQHRLKHTMPGPSIKADPDAPCIPSVSVCEPGSLLCGYCDYSTDVQYLLDRHITKHQANADLICPECEFSNGSTNEFAKHLKTHNEQKATFDCCFCNYSTVHSGNLPLHLESHKFVHFFDCPKCDRSYTSKNNLKNHFERYHVAEHVCPTCNAVMTKHKMLLHEEMHAEQDNPTFYCDDCGYKTNKKRLMRKHATKHLENNFVCTECQFRHPSAREFVEHLSVHGMLEETFACCFCHYSTSTASGLVQHLKAHQSWPIRFFDCPKCERSFRRRSELAQHLRQHHKDMHRCSVCGAVMTYSKLLRHMKLHKESGALESRLSNRFRCNHCVFTTKKKSLLRRHAPKHLVDNRLSCSICPFKTNIALRLATHLENHSESNIIRCCFCNFSTKNKSKLGYHVDQHRQVYLHDCTKCDSSFQGTNGNYSLLKHFDKMHIRKHVCQKRVQPSVRCMKKFTLYRLLKHQTKDHKAVPKEVPYYVCRGPKFKEEDTVRSKTEPTEPVPEAGCSSVKI